MGCCVTVVVSCCVFVQDLTVTVTSERGEHELELIADKEEISVINVEAFIDEQVRNTYCGTLM